MLNSVKIGPVTVEVPIGLAPMAGVTDLVYRKICREMGAGLLCTEMVSAKAIVYRNKNTDQIMRTEKEESPVALQLFGNDPEFLAEAVRMTCDAPYDIIDLNLGCPVPKVVKNGEGSALMKEPETVGKIVEALSKAGNRPVTVKMRSGFDAEHINAVEIAKVAQSADASALTVHARTRDQFYSGQADWTVIRRVKEAVSIPVFGNGDVKNGPTAKALLEETGCDGIQIGRAAMGNPWIFKEVQHFLQTGEELKTPEKEEVFAMILRHARELAEDKGEYIAIREMRSHAAWYVHGFQNAAKIRRQINTVNDLDGLIRLFS